MKAKQFYISCILIYAFENNNILYENQTKSKTKLYMHFDIIIRIENICIIYIQEFYKCNFAMSLKFELNYNLLGILQYSLNV
jgi:hypothetical protein